MKNGDGKGVYWVLEWVLVHQYYKANTSKNGQKTNSYARKPKRLHARARPCVPPTMGRASLHGQPMVATVWPGPTLLQRSVLASFGP